MLAYRDARMIVQCDTCYDTITDVPGEVEDSLHRPQPHRTKTDFCSEDCAMAYKAPTRAQRGWVRNGA